MFVQAFYLATLAVLATGMDEAEYKLEVRNLLQRFLFELHDLHQKQPTDAPTTPARSQDNRLSHDIITPSHTPQIVAPPDGSILPVLRLLHDDATSAGTDKVTHALPVKVTPKVTKTSPAVGEGRVKVEALLEEGEQLERNMLRVFDSLEGVMKRGTTPARCATSGGLCGVGRKRCCEGQKCSSEWQGKCRKCVAFRESCTYNLFCCDSGVTCQQKGAGNWVCT